LSRAEAQAGCDKALLLDWRILEAVRRVEAKSLNALVEPKISLEHHSLIIPTDRNQPQLEKKPTPQPSSLTTSSGDLDTSMAPSKPAAASAPFNKEEKVLCFHHEMLYEAKILDVRQTEDHQSWQYKIHYKGWKNTVCMLHGVC
jgi:hypothetical protein